MALKNLSPRMGALDLRTVRPPEGVSTGSADPFYQSDAWRTFRRALEEERGRICSGCAKAVPKDQMMIGHHLIPIKDGGPKLNPRNVILLCHPCHERSHRALREGP